jgi:hypothetical protein
VSKYTRLHNQILECYCTLSICTRLHSKILEIYCTLSNCTKLLSKILECYCAVTNCTCLLSKILECDCTFSNYTRLLSKILECYCTLSNCTRLLSKILFIMKQVYIVMLNWYYLALFNLSLTFCRLDQYCWICSLNMRKCFLLDIKQQTANELSFYLVHIAIMFLFYFYLNSQRIWWCCVSDCDNAYLGCTYLSCCSPNTYTGNTKK